jgi:hypothetical protein
MEEELFLTCDRDSVRMELEVRDRGRSTTRERELVTSSSRGGSGSRRTYLGLIVAI